MKTELALAQLNPIGQHIIIVINLIGEFLNILSIGLLWILDLMEYTVDEWRDTIYKRYFGTLF